MRRRPGRMIALGAAGLAAAAALAWLAVRELRGGGAATVAPRDAGAVAALVDGGAAAPAGPSSAPVKRVAPIRQAADAPDRTQPYRPAKLLRYSDGQPAKNPADDDRSPILERILAVTRPDGEQEAAVRAAWRAHEDGRRELLAKAPPPSIGDPFLDPRELAEIDRAFDELLQTILRHEQLARLVLEMPPPALEPEPLPPPQP